MSWRLIRIMHENRESAIRNACTLNKSGAGVSDRAMSNIDELQSRLTAAMDRIAVGVEAAKSKPPEPDAQTVQALEDERTANAQLRERVYALKTKADEELGSLRKQVEDSTSRIAALDLELQRLRTANQQLTDASAALREANAEGVGDADLINSALQAELEGLQAARASDVAEADAILAALTPLVAEAQKGADDASGKMGKAPNSEERD